MEEPPNGTVIKVKTSTIRNGKRKETWYLFFRHDEEAACFEIPHARWFSSYHGSKDECYTWDELNIYPEQEMIILKE